MRGEIQRRKRIFFLETALVFLGMIAVLVVSGLQILGAAGLALALGVVLVVAVLSQQQTSLVRPAKASQLRRFQAPELFTIVDELSRRSSLEGEPEIYLLNAPVLNAATLGSRERPMLIVTPMLVRALTDRELTAVLAHEISHIRHGDLMFFRIVEVVSMITVIIARVGWVLLIFYLPLAAVGGATVPLIVLVVLLAAPLASVLLQLGLSRAREYAADLGAVELTRDPEGLAEALAKIDNIGRSYLGQMVPVPRKRDNSVFRSHPPTERRVERLRSLGD